MVLAFDDVDLPFIILGALLSKTCRKYTTGYSTSGATLAVNSLGILELIP
jgi:hypothetical protein